MALKPAPGRGDGFFGGRVHCAAREQLAMSYRALAQRSESSVAGRFGIGTETAIRLSMLTRCREAGCLWPHIAELHSGQAPEHYAGGRAGHSCWRPLDA